HRAHASMATMVPFFGDRKAAGYLLRKEIEYLGAVTDSKPARPFVAVLGGAKVSDKIGVIEALLSRCDTICVGGAMAYTLLVAAGTEVGASRVERDALDLARRILGLAERDATRILLPVDHVVGASLDDDATPSIVTEIPTEMAGFDIGPQTIASFADAIAKAATVFWNGPLGVFEDPRYAAGTRAVAEAM